MGREAEAVKYRGRRRWNGSWGKVWWDNELLFEIQKFEAKVAADREDVYISISILKHGSRGLTRAAPLSV